MQIYYYQRRDRQPNFGDELNTWLWPRLLPKLFEPVASQASSAVFVGTGTLLNHRLPERTRQAEQVVIMGTGAGYEKPLQRIPPHWQIYCVRGPLSAQRLGVEATKAITDGGMLVRQVSQALPADPIQPKPISFMPHIHHMNFAAAQWQTICQQADIHLIDPRWPVERVLNEIRQSQILLAEAMHGAIAADSLRIPWIPIVTSPYILPFKWQDWCQSMGVSYQPQYLPVLQSYRRLARGVRSGIRASGYWFKTLQQAGCTTFSQFGTTELTFTANRLRKISQRTNPTLSRDQVLGDRLEQFSEQLQKLSQVSA